MQFSLGAHAPSRVPTGALAGRIERAKSKPNGVTGSLAPVAGEAPATAPEAGALPISTESFRLRRKHRCHGRLGFPAECRRKLLHFAQPMAASPKQSEEHRDVELDGCDLEREIHQGMQENTEQSH